MAYARCLQLLLTLWSSNAFFQPFVLVGRQERAARLQRQQQSLDGVARSGSGDGITYMPATTNPVIGNFFDNTTSEMSFIQCYMHCLGTLKGVQYGIGYPIDTPVLLTYLSEDETELKPVFASTYPPYDDLLNHVASQMDRNDYQLYKTPLVLTLQGYFDDDDENEEEDEDGEEEDGEEEDEEDDDDDEDADAVEEEKERSFWNSSPIGKLNEMFDAMPDFTIVRADSIPGVTMQNDSVVAQFILTEEDSKGMQVAHRKADRISSEASDVSLIASFHFQKRNFHLVKLLDPIFVVGRRIEDIKGYYFSLLNNDETPTVTPALEKLIFASKPAEAAKQTKSQATKPTAKSAPSRAAIEDEDEDAGTGTGSGSGSGTGTGGRRLLSSRRRWSTRKKKEE